MLLQTILQLNILILATPALAGWTALPLAQPGAVHAIGIVRQCRAVSVIPRTVQAETRSAARLQSVGLPDASAGGPEPPSDIARVFPAASPAAPSSFHPFPYAIRAP